MSTLTERVTAEVNAEIGRQRLTDAEIALRIGRPRGTVNRWLNGTTPIAIDDLALVAKAIGKRVDELFALANGRPAPGKAVGGGQLSPPYVKEWFSVIQGEGDITARMTGHLALAI